MEYMGVITHLGHPSSVPRKLTAGSLKIGSWQLGKLEGKTWDSIIMKCEYIDNILGKFLVNLKTNTPKDPCIVCLPTFG